MRMASFAFVLRPPSGGRNTGGGLSPAPLKKRIFGKERFMNQNNRTEILSFRVTPEEKETIAEKALSSYRLVSMYLRDCALGKKILAVKGLEETETQLRRIGNNLNQLTRAVNCGEVSAVNLTEFREEVAGVWRLLNGALQNFR